MLIELYGNDTCPCYTYGIRPRTLVHTIGQFRPGPILIGMGLLVLIFGSSIFLMGIRIVPTVGRFTFVFFIPVAVITILGLAASGLSPL